MLQDKIFKLKKYLFFISILFFVSTFSHLCYVYLYNDSSLEAVEWGTISEALIGTAPSLNPLKPLEWNNKYMMELLYRSLLQYNVKTQKIESDIASCDLSNLRTVQCILEPNVKWSNGEFITVDDIYATYNLLQNSDINPIIWSLLGTTTITKAENAIVFKNDKKDINFVNTFFQPIIPKSVIETLWEDELKWDFSIIDQIYSGKFKITNIDQNFSLGITKFVLQKNNHYFNNDIMFDQFVIKLFSDQHSFLQNKHTVNIFNDRSHFIWTSVPRFQNLDYTLPQHVSLYINKETINKNSLRWFIFEKINRENLIKILWDSFVKPVYNPYLNETNIDKMPEKKNYDELIASLGYYKKAKLIQDLIPSTKETVNYSEEATTFSWSISEDDKSKLSIDKFQKDSEIVYSPDYVDKYNFISSGDILIKWKVTNATDAVIINDYQLKWFSAGNKTFNYRLRESYGTLKEWVNTYKIYFKKWETKELVEEITFIYHKNKTQLTKAKQNFIYSLHEAEFKKSQEAKITEERNKPNTVDLIKEEKLKKLSELDETYYYNENLERFTLKLSYISTETDLEKTAIYIKDSLKEIWLDVALQPESINSLSKSISNKKSYDLLLTGVNLWYFPSNIFPYFHSSQVKNGYNFSSLKKTSLDILLEELKSDILNPEKETEIKNKILSILKEEQVVKSLYTPKINLLVDKTINTSLLPSELPNKELRSNILYNSYIREKKTINFDNKSPLSFLKYLFNKIND